MKKVLFYRNYKQFTGGHLKVQQYIDHVIAAKGFEPLVYFSKKSSLKNAHLRKSILKYRTKQWEPDKADIIFLAGKDWLQLPEGLRHKYPVPVINLIQHIRHSEPQNMRHAFLSHYAVRICVSKEVQEAIMSTGLVNGPCYTIENCIDSKLLPKPIPFKKKKYDILVVSFKADKDMQRFVYDSIKDISKKIFTLSQWIPQKKFLKFINSSRIVIFLPNRKEGFYLPALEAMNLGSIVICPDCIGNRSFCREGWNCYRPNYSSEEICNAAHLAIKASDTKREAMIKNAYETAKQHHLEKERSAFHEILSSTHNIWE